MFDPTADLFLTYYLVTSYILTVSIALMVSGFLGFHLWLMVRQYTTIEYCEKRSKPTFAKQSPYDLGIIRNLQNVLGSNPLVWLLPISKIIKIKRLDSKMEREKGISFEVREDLVVETTSN